MKTLVFLLLVVSFPFAQANEIAFSFDDAPRGKNYLFSGVERARRLIETLERHKIQTVFFTNTANLGRDDGQKIMEAYANAGHLIANHTHSHPDIRSTPIDDYIKNFEEADRNLKQFKTYTKWFRYPYLAEGKTIEVRDRMRNHLKANNYAQGYVTVDNYDYFIDDLLMNAHQRGMAIDSNRACQMLTDIMWEGIQFYDSLAKKHIGSVRHVLLMHETDLEVLCLDKLIGHLQTKGWKIISPIRAYEDPLLKNEPDTLYLGQGRIAAMVHALTGIKHVSRWESEDALTAEFKRRQIAQK